MGQSASKSVAASMVASKSTNILDYELDRENRDAACTSLNQFTDDIIAVWIIARPIDGMAKWEHWTLIVQGRKCIVSLDFLEHNGKGSFRVKSKPATQAELNDFFFYQYVNKPKEKYRIVSSVTPSPLREKIYWDYIDEQEKQRLKQFVKENKTKRKENNLDLDDIKSNNDNNNGNNIISKAIKANSKVCDIVNFLEMWTEVFDKAEKKDKPYNPIKHNCQNFAVELFEYLVDNKYKDKVELAQGQLQSPADKKKIKRNESM